MAQLAVVQYFTAPREQVAEIARAAVGVARRLIADPELALRATADRFRELKDSSAS